MQTLHCGELQFALQFCWQYVNLKGMWMSVTLRRKFPENSRVKYIQQIDMLLHTGTLFPTPHQPVFIPDPAPTCLYPRPCANLSLSPTLCQPVFVLTP
jgi:hypothetical protein